MIIYTVNNPFMCRPGQFVEGERSLCIGLAEAALKKNKTYRCYLGKNKKTWYDIKCSDALEFAKEKDSWTFSKFNGKRIAILPIFLFQQHKSRWSAEKYQEKEVARAEINTSRLSQLGLF